MSQFNAPHFKSPEAARTYLEGLRWGAERVCPHCGTVNESFLTNKPGVYRCRTKECRKDFTVTTKSVMESSHIKLNVWLQAFFLMASSKKGVSAHQLHRTLGVTYKTAWFLAHRIREAMRAGGLLPPKARLRRSKSKQPRSFYDALVPSLSLANLGSPPKGEQQSPLQSYLQSQSDNPNPPAPQGLWGGLFGLGAEALSRKEKK